MPQTPRPEITESHRTRALVFLFFVSLFNYGDRNMIGVLVPAIKSDLGLSDTEIGFITGLAFSLLYAIMGIPIARLADTISRRGVISIALVTWSAMTCACGIAQNFMQLALARVMVGIGEAGATPPSHAIIADLFPKARRAFAISIYAFGSPAGMVLAYLGGAWITQEYGWRATLFAFGLPGMVLAFFIYRFMPEPPRGHSEQVENEAPITPARLADALRTLFSKPAFRQNAFASSLFAFVWFVLLSWGPSFFTRTHNMPLAEVGAGLAFAIGVPQLIGTWIGGTWGDKWGARDPRWYAWICAFSMIGSAPLYFVVFLSPNPVIGLLALFLAVMISIMQSGPQHWITQAVAGPRMRATATALYLLIVNLVSGFGTLLVGFLSEALRATYGDDGLGYAMLIVAVIFSAWSAVHFWLIGRTLADDIAKT